MCFSESQRTKNKAPCPGNRFSRGRKKRLLFRSWLPEHCSGGDGDRKKRRRRSRYLAYLIADALPLLRHACIFAFFIPNWEIRRGSPWRLHTLRTRVFPGKGEATKTRSIEILITGFIENFEFFAFIICNLIHSYFKITVFCGEVQNQYLR